MKRVFILSIIFLFGHAMQAQTNLAAPEKYKLKNKMQVVFMDYGSLPVTYINLFINTGKKNESPGMQSIAGLTANSLLLGNERYTRIQQDSIRDGIGASLNAGSNDNFTTVSMQFPNIYTEPAMDLLGNVILHPTFPKDEIAENVNRTLTYNTPSKMDIMSLASVYNRFFVFGAGNPLGRHFYASQLNKISSDQIKEFYKFNYTPKNCIIVVSGKPDKEKVKALIEKYFGSWEAAYSEVNSVSLAEPEINKKECAFVNRENATQAALCWTKKGPDVKSRDLDAFEVANDVFTMMLTKTIREKEGKTYGIGSSFNPQNNNGIYSVSTQVRSEVMYETMMSFDKVLKQLYDSGAPTEILEIVKNQHKNELASLETPSQLVYIFNPLLYPDFEKRKQYMEQVANIDNVRLNKIIKKYFNPNDYKLLIAGNEATLSPQLSRINNLVKMPLSAIEVDDAK
jgi:zinc protease